MGRPGAKSVPPVTLGSAAIATEAEDVVTRQLTVLDRPVMSKSEASRQLRIPPSTLTNWLEGVTRRGIFYNPVLREAPTGQTTMTWGEIVEARYLRAYRESLVAMQELRIFISYLRDRMGVPYPLAHQKPFIGPGRRLVMEAQVEAGIPESEWMVFESNTGQTLLGARVSEFLQRVEFDGSDDPVVHRLRPAGLDSPVIMRPALASGAATVRGIRTEIIAEQEDAGATVAEIAEEFSLPTDVVRAALAYEWARDAA